MIAASCPSSYKCLAGVQYEEHNHETSCFNNNKNNNNKQASKHVNGGDKYFLSITFWRIAVIIISQGKEEAGQLANR